MAEKKKITKADIVAFNDLKSEVIEVPEWGGSVTIRRMTGGERDAYEADIFESKGAQLQLKRENFRAKLIARCLVDDNGERMFSDGEIAALSKKSAAALDRLFAACQRLNGMTGAEQEKIEKNLDIVG
ncbi:MAG: hypothetical protein PHC52_14010 [Syntrophales bacterium]|jgi:hypothetical protein|nr:hypothetical protein [Syntrophales bacterium]